MESKSQSIGSEVGKFIRIEDKFLVDSGFENQLLLALKNRMSPSYLNKNTKYTLIESLYFDSGEYGFFQDHFLKKETRYKLRIRRYAPDGIWSDDPALVELKAKKNGVCEKVRFSIPNEDVSRLVEGRSIVITNCLVELNEDIEFGLLLERIQMINKLIRERSLKLVMSINYHRYAFEENGFRATVDRQIKAECQFVPADQVRAHLKSSSFWNQAEKLSRKYDGQNKVVLELKHTGQIPSWAQNLVLNLESKKTSFSKYCWSVVNLMKQPQDSVTEWAV